MLKYHLVPNPLTKNPQQYRAQVTGLKSYDTDAILELMLQRGSSLTKGDAKLALQIYTETITSILEDGGAVRTELFNAAPSITGNFSGPDDAFDETRHQTNINLRPGTALQDTEPHIQTEKRDSVGVGPIISSVDDVLSNTTNKTLTPGGVIKIHGGRLKVNTSRQDNGIFLIHTSSDETIHCTTLARNSPSQIITLLPTDLPSGTYRLQVRSSYSHRTDTQLLHTDEFKHRLTVR
ncbi:MAG: DUF4469 domain-containing protein [Opitutales bacterium]|nr:DUF4469 domain-containing protein [Opitutales bacterium]